MIYMYMKDRRYVHSSVHDDSTFSTEYPFKDKDLNQNDIHIFVFQTNSCRL